MMSPERILKHLGKDLVIDPKGLKDKTVLQNAEGFIELMKGYRPFLIKGGKGTFTNRICLPWTSFHLVCNPFGQAVNLINYDILEEAEEVKVKRFVNFRYLFTSETELLIFINP